MKNFSISNVVYGIAERKASFFSIIFHFGLKLSPLTSERVVIN